MITIVLHHPKATLEHLGLIPHFLDDEDPRPAREQLDANYQHGGGWRAFSGFTFNPATKVIQYPDDPPYSPIASMFLRDEEILMYPHAWILILQPDGSHEIARMD